MADGYLKKTSKIGANQEQWRKLGAPVRNPALLKRVSKPRLGSMTRKGAR